MYRQIQKSLYKSVLKPILFSLDPHFVHEKMLYSGELLGKSEITKIITSRVFEYKSKRLNQKIDGVKFQNPIGLAAGFDYEARLTQILPSIGFGFFTAGTITNMPYEGNPMPMLGRLPKSKSLLVNKGFKNLGADETIHKLEKLSFSAPFGVSIGRTNSKTLTTQKQSVKDIVECFTKFENSKVSNSYYELNISCPNLFGNVEFYSTKNLKELLSQVQKVNIKKPVYIKMPIDQTDSNTLKMLEVISKYFPKGVIFGNLQKNRKDKSLYQDEVAKFTKGNFSGKPTYERSNELISLSYKHFKDRFTIIGCGGVFSAEDAIEKIARGASLVQLITGMIYEGPQLISEINIGIEKELIKRKYKNVSDLVGKHNNLHRITL